MIIKNDFDLSNISYIKVGGITKTYIEIENVIELFNLQNDFIAIGNCSKILFAFDYLSKTIVKFKISKIVLAISSSSSFSLVSLQSNINAIYIL